MVVEGDVVFRISPPSQINNLNPFRNSSSQKDFWDFNTVYSHNNFFGLEEKHKKENEKVLILSSKLNSKDILYIPGFFFVQYRVTTDTMLGMMWDYKCNSRIMKTMFKVLYDDNVGDEDIFD
jgi:hypothetical protein